MARYPREKTIIALPKLKKPQEQWRARFWGKSMLFHLLSSARKRNSQFLHDIWHFQVSKSTRRSSVWRRLSTLVAGGPWSGVAVSPDHGVRGREAFKREREIGQFERKEAQGKREGTA
jgi:hypothetical protein